METPLVCVDTEDVGICTSETEKHCSVSPIVRSQETVQRQPQGTVVFLNIQKVPRVPVTTSFSGN
jgi:hypothetical protein